MNIAVSIFDRSPIVILGLMAILLKDDNIKIAAASDDMEAFLASALEGNPTVRLIGLGSGLNCLNDLDRVRSALDDQIPAVILANTEDKSVLRRAMNLGSFGFVAKKSGAGVIRRAVHSVAAGHIFIDPAFGWDKSHRATWAEPEFGKHELDILATWDMLC